MAAHILAFVAALMVVLPPGTCALWAAPSNEAETAVVHSCCRIAHETTAPHGPQPEPTAAHDCCCDRVALSPERGLDWADSVSATVAPLPMLAWTANPASLGDSVSLISPFHEGPPLHLLKCVWRN